MAEQLLPLTGQPSNTYRSAILLR